MKPRELYSGQAPAAMGMMGQGLIEAGANIANTIQRGYANMGQGLAQGINAAADAYQQYKQMKAENKAASNMYADLRDSGMLPESLAKAVDQRTQGEDSWYSKATLAERNAFWKAHDPIFKAAIANDYALQRIKAETGSRIFGEKAKTDEDIRRDKARAAGDIIQATIGSRKAYGTLGAAPTSMAGVPSGDSLPLPSGDEQATDALIRQNIQSAKDRMQAGEPLTPPMQGNLRDYRKRAEQRATQNPYLQQLEIGNMGF